jgi:signal transduction histidine kinase
MLINEILDLAKVESGTMTLSLEPVAFGEVFQTCQPMIEPLANKRGIQVRFPEETDVYVLADRTGLKHVLINLLSNAIKCNREHGTVTVDCVPADTGRVRISVQDTGAGLDSTQLGVIFLPFNRLGRETGDEEGTGIGLALAGRLVELMRGEIGIASTVDIGSTFWIKLPSRDSVASRREDDIKKSLPEIKTAQKPLSRKTLLYVEDMSSDAITGMKAGFFHYITRPIDINAFTETIDSALVIDAKRRNE